MTEDQLRQRARTLGFARVGIGVTMVALPGLAGRGWLGDHGKTRGAKLLVRAIGVRDIVVGLGTALSSDGDVTRLRRWVRAGAVSDGLDAVGTIVAARRTPKLRALSVLSGAIPGALGAVWLDRQLGAVQAT